MMLASTVQFSRYGRYRPSVTCWRGEPVLVEEAPQSGRSLRTQQRARPAHPLRPAFRAAERPY